MMVPSVPETASFPLPLSLLAAAAVAATAAAAATISLTFTAPFRTRPASDDSKSLSPMDAFSATLDSMSSPLTAATSPDATDRGKNIPNRSASAP